MNNFIRLSACALVLTSGCTLSVSGGGSCRFSEPRKATLDASGAQRALIIASAGALQVLGREGAREARVDGVACSSSEDGLEDVRLIAERHGDLLRIEADLGGPGWANRGLDLTVELPAGLAVEIDDSSGEMYVEGLASVKIEDGSGEIMVRRIAGAVSIEDGSGEIEIQKIDGDVMIEDGSGEIDVEGIGGDLVIDDASGGVEIRQVAGHVVVRDRSGDIDADGVGGDFTVESDGSGSVREKNVAGRVRVAD